jgi:acyl carrier protein
MAHSSVSELIALVLDIEPSRVGPTTHRDDLDEWDSLAQLSLVSALEETYSVMMTTDQMNRCVAVSEIEAVLSELGVTQQQP